MNETPLETQLCRACNQVKPITSFYKAYQGRLARCKVCKNNGILIPKKDKDYVKSNMRLHHTSKKDYIDTYKFLRDNFDYDLSRSIHIQFCERHGLTPNNPIEEFLNYFTPKDCGLV